MITIALLISLIGLVLSFIFTVAIAGKPAKPIYSWLARIGELSFFAGLLAWLFALGNKTAF